MASTLATLRAQCRALLASTTDWPDATLDKFIADAIRLYSTRFPRKWRHTITLATGTQTYALPGGHDIADILSVEYPAGEDPPEFIYPVEPDSQAFADGEEVYAFVAVADSVAIGSDTVAGYIQFAETVATGETAIVTYHGTHAIPAAADNNAQITVPAAHWEALIAFVDFRCHWELETDKASTISDTTIALSQLGENGRRAWNRYRELVALYAASDSRSKAIAWKMP